MRIVSSLNMSPLRKTPVIISCLLLVLLTLAFYNPVIHNQFTGFDDWSYILKNSQIQSGLTWGTVKWSFTTFREGNWDPLTWLSHALDYQLFHLNPVGHHYTNLLLHAVNAVLLFLLLRRSTGRFSLSLIVAALFALHPVNVESVAWAAERKNVLSTLFFLLALHAYDRYARSYLYRGYLYFCVTAAFALGLLAKPQIVILPFVLLLWDYWPLQRLRADLHRADDAYAVPRQSLRFLVFEKLPLVVLAAADCVVTIFAERSAKAVRSITEVSMSQRLANVPISYVRYIGKLFLPYHLAPLYPRSASALPKWQVFAATALLLLISGFVWKWRSRRYLALGWLWFLGTLIPMIGIIAVGDHAMADRFAYIPYMGLFVALTWGLAEVTSQYRISLTYRAAAVVSVLLVLGSLTYRQVTYWHDDETLWRYTLRVTDGNYVAHNNLGLIYAGAGRTEEAVAEFRAAKSLHNYPANQVLTLVLYELKVGHPREAIEECDSVLRTSSDPKVEAVAWSEIGQAHLQLRQYDQAETFYQNALRVSPDNPIALVGSGVLDLRQGRSNQAASELLRAVNSDPSDVNFILLAQALRRVGREADASHALAEAKKVSADLNAAQNTAGQFLTVAGLSPL
jgi:protein O-mannosyl-transferase